LAGVGEELADIYRGGRVKTRRSSYVLICFYPDTSTPALLPHALKGMVERFTIT
jgi:hypothetical protein